MGHVYDEEFMEYVAASSQYAATKIVSRMSEVLQPTSVLDVGCAVGAWLAAWNRTGVSDTTGVDGPYVNRSQLLFDPVRFHAADLTKPLVLGRRFDLVQSLEVAEHIEPAASELFVANVAEHAEKYVLFSAAPLGQGGEYHINERPYEFWRRLFKDSGFVPFDCVRPVVAGDVRVSYWYRYNVILYVRREHVAALPESVLKTRVPDDTPIPDISPIPFKLRKLAVRVMPYAMQHRVAQLKARFFPTGRI